MSQTNRPIAPSPVEVSEWLADSFGTLVRRRDELLAGYRRFTEACPNGIADDDMLGRANDFGSARGLLGAFLKEADTERTREKLPFRKGADAVDSFFSRLIDPIKSCQADVRGKLTTYEVRRREAERLEIERRAAEAARLAAEAAAAQDAAIASMAEDDLERALEASDAAEQAAVQAEAVAEPTKVRGDLGTVVSLRTRWVADLEHSDLMALVKAVAAGKAPLAYLQFNSSRIGYAVRSEKVREIPGVRIIEERAVV